MNQQNRDLSVGRASPQGSDLTGFEPSEIGAIDGSPSHNGASPTRVGAFFEAMKF